MAVLMPSPNSSTLLATTSSQNNILTLFSPALAHSLYFVAILQRFLSTTTLFVFLRCYLLSAVVLRQSYYATQVLAIQGYYALSMVTRHALSMGWKATEPIRKKLFFEFAVFILGNGNGLLLLMFWPGWLVIGGGVWGAWKVCH